MSYTTSCALTWFVRTPSFYTMVYVATEAAIELSHCLFRNGSSQTGQRLEKQYTMTITFKIGMKELAKFPDYQNSGESEALGVD